MKKYSTYGSFAFKIKLLKEGQVLTTPIPWMHYFILFYFIFFSFGIKQNLTRVFNNMEFLKNLLYV